MTIASGEMRLYYAAQRNQTTPAANGGRPSQTAVVCGQWGNVWPAVSEAERAAGATRCEKLFWRLTNSANEAGSNALVALAATTGSDEYEWIVAGDQDNLQSALPASPRRYSVGALSPAAVGATSITVTLPDASLADCFAAGDTLLLCGANPDFAAGTAQLATLQSKTASATVLTLGLAAPLTRAFSGTAYCASCISVATLAPSVTVTSGTFAGNIAANNLGTIRQDWTATYTAEGLRIEGDEVGNIGVFAISSDISPTNSAAGAPYFTIPADGHGASPSGSFAFSTYAAAIGVFRFKRTPPGATVSRSTVPLICTCES